MDEATQLAWLYDLYRMGQPELLRDVSSGETISSIPQHILQHIITCFKADTGSLALCNGNNGNKLHIVAAAGLPDIMIGSVIPKDKSVLGWVVEKGEPILLNGDTPNISRIHGGMQTGQTAVVVSAMCWPLMQDQGVVGALSIHRNKGKAAFTQDEFGRGSILVGLISVIIAHTNQAEQLLHKPDQNEAHAQLLQTDERLSGILASLDDVVWSVLPDTFHTIYMSQAAEKVYGRPSADFYNTPNLWLDIVDASDRIRVLSEMSTLSDKGVLDLDYRIIHPDGKIRWIHDHVRVINDINGKPVRLDGISVDITQHKFAEEKLKQGNKELNDAYSKLQAVQGQLLQSEKMASIGQLAAGVAHEINNPIGYVHSNLGSLQKYLDDIFLLMDAYEKVEPVLSQHPEAMAVIHAVKTKIDLQFLKEDVVALMSESREGITRVKKIVQDLKDFSHVDSEDEWQFIDLRQGLDSTLNIVNNEIKYKADVIKEYGDIPNVECLPSQLNQVFMNLFVNAAHAIEERGTITIRTGTRDDKVWVEVSDTGKGISAEHLSRVFDPFFTTKPVGTGTGLGLSVSYSIIQKHHGSIDVVSEVGKGTTFRILLPIKQPEEQLS